MSIGIVSAAYISAAILFILSLGGLSNQESAKRAVWYGIVGMALAVIATVFGPGSGKLWLVIVMFAIAAAIGWQVAMKVQMTEMPQLVAALHSFVGLAAVLIGFNAHIELASVMKLDAVAREALTGFAGVLAHKTGVEISILKVEVFLGVFIGAVTFTGSIIAFGKLAGKVDGKAKKLPGGHMLNAGAAALSLLLLILYVQGAGFWALFLMTLLAFFIGYHLIMGIGGADMPVVVSMLNSYSGWAAAAIGFTLGNDLLIVVGALVGSSGAILSYIMCKAMNRSFVSVILGGFGNTTGPAQAIEGEQIAIDVDGVATALNDADSVIIVPGYGMAVAQAAIGVGTDPQAARRRQGGALRHTPGRRPPAGPYERAARRGEGALRHRPGDGRDQRGLPEHRRRDRHRLERHRQSGGAGGPELADRRHAGARGLESEAGLRLQARPGYGLFRHREPALLQGEHADVLRRRQEEPRRAAAQDRLIALTVQPGLIGLHERPAETEKPAWHNRRAGFIPARRRRLRPPSPAPAPP